MSFSTPVPSDVEATSLIDLADDCREVSAVLHHRTVRFDAVVPLARMPFSFGAMPVEITEDLLVTVAGLDDY